MYKRQDQSIDREKLLRLRSIGMNLVFFDTDVAHPFADSVFLDNEDAVETLLRAGDTFCLLYTSSNRRCVRSEDVSITEAWSQQMMGIFR